MVLFIDLIEDKLKYHLPIIPCPCLFSTRFISNCFGYFNIAPISLLQTTVSINDSCIGNTPQGVTSKRMKIMKLILKLQDSPRLQQCISHANLPEKTLFSFVQTQISL